VDKTTIFLPGFSQKIFPDVDAREILLGVLIAVLHPLSPSAITNSYPCGWVVVSVGGGCYCCNGRKNPEGGDPEFPRCHLQGTHPPTFGGFLSTLSRILHNLGAVFTWNTRPRESLES